MAAQPLIDDDWDSLLFSVAQGTCILMLGPDFLTEAKGEVRRPVMNSFADHLGEHLGTETRLTDGAGLAEIAQDYQRARGRNRLVTTAQRFFDGRTIGDDALQDLFALPFPLIVSAAPGPQIENAVSRQSMMGYYNYRGSQPGLLPEGSRDRPLVYHLYGSIEEPASLVYSESDLLDFLVAVVSRSPELPVNLASAFRDPARSFLFLGFGLRHWHFRILMHVLAAQQTRESTSFALEVFEDNAPDSLATQHFYHEGHRVQFFDMEPDVFAAELRQRFEDSSERTAIRSRPATTSALVFICHASEDASRAAQLTKDLEARGIPVWLDREKLRGGTRWDNAIEHTISKEITHFVVLESTSLRGKEEGYVNKEIRLALDREQTFRSSLRFVIPVLIDGPENTLGDLEDFQHVDLMSDGGLDQLVSVIARDSERRRRGPE